VYGHASMGGLVVKQMLRQAAKDKSCSKFLKQTAGVVCISIKSLPLFSSRCQCSTIYLFTILAGVL
jgi:hypothetical protein